MKQVTRHAWVLLFLVGVCLAVFAFDYLVVIPAIDPADPDRGWAWLSSDQEVIAYIKFWFRIFGFWVLAVAIFVMAIAGTGYRQFNRWAWYCLLYVPLHILIHMFLWPWTIPILAILFALALAGLLIPFRGFFPRRM